MDFPIQEYVAHFTDDGQVVIEESGLVLCKMSQAEALAWLESKIDDYQSVLSTLEDCRTVVREGPLT